MMRIFLIALAAGLLWMLVASMLPLTVAQEPSAAQALQDHEPDTVTLEAGRRATRQFFDGEEALWKAFGPEMKAVMGDDPAGLAAFRLQVDSQLGAEEEVVSERTLSQRDARIYLRTSRFAKTDSLFEIRFTFEADVITGFLIQPERTEAPSDYVDYETKTELRLPFEGAWTVFWGGRTLEENYHTFTRDQRFAYDILVMKDGKSHDGDGTLLEQYHCFGLPVLAPGAGVAVSAKDGVVDNVPGEMNPAQALGNYVIIDHENGEYSFLAHLKQGSLAIQEGDRVDAGTLLGVCGNSGNTTEPHIHYHLQDTPVFGKGQGMPAQFQGYMLGKELIERGEPVRLQEIQNP